MRCFSRCNQPFLHYKPYTRCVSTFLRYHLTSLSLKELIQSRKFLFLKLSGHISINPQYCQYPLKLSLQNQRGFDGVNFCATEVPKQPPCPPGLPVITGGGANGAARAPHFEVCAHNFSCSIPLSGLISTRMFRYPRLPSRMCFE